MPDPNPAILKWVRREFELRSLGKTFDEIRQVCMSEGLVPSSRLSSYRANSVHKRLTNPFYYGHFKWKGQLYKARHELIIAPETLARVSASFGKRYSNKDTQTRAIFANGWLRCSETACGCQVIFDPKTKINKQTGAKREFRYYHCTNGKGIHTSMKGMNITEEKIWDQLGAAVGRISISSDLAAELAEALNEAHVKADQTTRLQMDVYRQRLQELENMENDLYDDLKRGVIDDEGYRRLLAKVRGERSEYTRLLEQLQISLNQAFRETAQSILELASSVKSLWLSRSPRERRDFLEDLHH